MKKKAKKTELKNKFSVEKLLKKDNKSVIEFVDGIGNSNEKQSTLKELIDCLDNSLLDRDAGITGPKLNEQLKQRLANNGAAVKEYKLEDLIWWKGTEGQLIFLIEELIKQQLLDKTVKEKIYATISQHFKNKLGKTFIPKQLSQAAQNLIANRNMKPKNAECIETIIKGSKEME